MTSGLSAAVDDLPAPRPKADNPQSAVIIKAGRPFQATLERRAVFDVTCALARLTPTLDRLQAAGAIAEEVHRRPEVLCAHERHRKFSQVFPGRLRDGVVAYQIIPVDADTPPPKDLAVAFGVDSFDLFTLIEDALRF